MKTVVFACVHNAGRSQIAATLFNALADPGRARAISAGTQPGEQVHPEVVEAMRELGFELSGTKPQRLTYSLARDAQLLITMGCGDQCPVVPGLRRDDWPLEDPKGKALATVRSIRDEIGGRVRRLLAQEQWVAPGPDLLVRPALPSDLAAVEQLLRAHALPPDGADEHFGNFQLAVSGARVLGVVGLELHGKAALLRSLVVDASVRGTGLAVRLTHAAIALARARGATSINLLTTTAAPFFTRRGFEMIAWEALPAPLSASRELTGACPRGATAMHLVL